MLETLEKRADPRHAVPPLTCLVQALQRGEPQTSTMENEQLSGAQKDLIRDSWQIVSQEQLHHGTVLFTRLFQLEPELTFLFHYNSTHFSSVQECLSSSEFTEHIRKVMTVIDAAVQNLDSLPSLEEYLTGLGKKHRATGVKLESFNTVGESLLYALELGLGETFTSDARAAWSRLYAIVVSAMSRGWWRDPQGQ